MIRSSHPVISFAFTSPCVHVFFYHYGHCPFLIYPSTQTPLFSQSGPVRRRRSALPAFLTDRQASLQRYTFWTLHALNWCSPRTCPYITTDCGTVPRFNSSSSTSVSSKLNISPLNPDKSAVMSKILGITPDAQHFSPAKWTTINSRLSQS